MGASQKKARNWDAELFDGFITLVPCTGIPHTGHAVLEKHIGQLQALKMEVRIDQAGEQRQPTSIHGFALPRVHAASALLAISRTAHGHCNERVFMSPPSPEPAGSISCDADADERCG